MWTVNAYSWDGRPILTARVQSSAEADALAQRWLSLGMVARVAVTDETRKVRGPVS